MSYSFNPPINGVIQRQPASYNPYPSPPVYTQPRMIPYTGAAVATATPANAAPSQNTNRGGRRRSTARRSSRRNGKRSHVRGRRRIHSRRR